MSLIVWLVVGVSFLISEVLTGTFVFLFFGTAACVVALLMAAWPISLAVQILVFALSSLLGVAVLRRQLLARSAKNIIVNDVSQELILNEDLPPGGQGVSVYQGVPFPVVNVSQEFLKSGERVRIKKTEGIKLLVERAQSK
jgi:membrane protein implicated in regulation of membrane protease activity